MLLTLNLEFRKLSKASECMYLALNILFDLLPNVIFYCDGINTTLLIISNNDENKPSKESLFLYKPHDH